MTDTNKNPGEKLTVAPSKPLSLKRSVEQGVVRQSFSHGRSKAVVVEKVKRRVGPEGKVEAAPAPAPAPSAPAPTARRPAPPQPTGRGSAPGGPAPRSSGVVLRTLTDEERNARAHALADAKVREAEERKIAEEEARRRNERETRERAEREASEARKREEEDRRRHDEETKKRAEDEAKKRFGDAEAKPATTTTPTRTPVDVRSIVPEVDEDDAPRPRRGGAPGRPAPAPAPKPTRGGAEKRRGRLTLVTALAADEVRERSVASFRRRVQRMTGHRDAETKEKIARDVVIPESITIQESPRRARSFPWSPHRGGRSCAAHAGGRRQPSARAPRQRRAPSRA